MDEVDVDDGEDEDEGEGGVNYILECWLERFILIG